MRRRFSMCLAGVLMVASAGLAGGAAVEAQTAAPGYVSVIFGRTQWVTTSTIGGVPCTPLPGAVPLGVTHDALAARGIPGTGVVITTRTPPTGLACFNGYVLHPGWDQLEAWHAEGWRFVSGATHADVTTLDYEQTLTETCGSLPEFAAHGMDASGLFAYGNNSWTNAAQADPTSRCFAYGRRYWTFQPNVRSTLTSPWMQKTHSVNGGNCNDPTQACYNAGFKYRYHSPARLAELMHTAPDTWFAVQFYRLVQDKGTFAGHAWDCTSDDWRRHWTSKGELYCYNDFLMIMDALQAAVAGGGVQVADPGTVAAAWGRVLDPPEPGASRSTATTVTCTEGSSSVCTASVRDASDGVPGAPAGTVSFSTDGGGAFEPPTCELTGVRPATSCAVTYTPEPDATTPRQVTASFGGSADHLASLGSVTQLPGIDTAPPAVELTNPPGTTVPKFVTGYLLTAVATDASGIEHVRFFIGGNLRCTDLVEPYTCPWNTPKAGRTFQLRVTARDGTGKEASVNRTVTTI